MRRDRASSAPKTGWDLPDCNDPDVVAFLRSIVAPVLESGCEAHPDADFSCRIVRRLALGDLFSCTDQRDGIRKWFLMLNLRGAEVANLAWGGSQAPHGATRETVTDPGVSFAESIHAPIAHAANMPWSLP